MVSAKATSTGPAAAAVRAISTTRCGSTSPSNGQPKAVDMVICARRPRARARRTTSQHIASEASEVAP